MCGGALPQASLPLIDSFPPTPSPWAPTDWVSLTASALSILLDATRVDPFLPLLWWDDSHRNNITTTFGLPSYVGARTGAGAGHESIAGAALVLTAALSGRNVSCVSGGGFTCVDLERMLLSYYDVDHASSVWVDAVSPNASFWYQAWVSMLPLMVSDASGSDTLHAALRGAGRAWLRVEAALGAPHPDFNVSSINFSPTGTPMGIPGDGSRYPLPVTSGGIAWLLYTTRAALGEEDEDAPALLDGATQALEYLFTLSYDPYWEVLLPYAALLSARMNAERGTAFNTSQLLNWVLEDDLPSRFPWRWGWGTMASSWGGVDVHGLTGAVSDRGGYAFAMDTFATLAAFLPLIRYEAQFACALGRYASNAANAARLFFPRFNDPAAQSDWVWVKSVGEGADALSYEGVRKWGFNATVANITGPYATGDGRSQDNLPTNIAMCV